MIPRVPYTDASNGNHKLLVRARQEVLNKRRQAVRFRTILRDPGAVIKTTAPVDGEYDFAHWGRALAHQSRIIAEWLAMPAMQRVAAQDATVPVALEAIRASFANLLPVFRAVADAHRDPDGTLRTEEPLTVAERTMLADALDAEIEV